MIHPPIDHRLYAWRDQCKRLAQAEQCGELSDATDANDFRKLYLWKLCPAELEILEQLGERLSWRQAKAVREWKREQSRRSSHEH